MSLFAGKRFFSQSMSSHWRGSKEHGAKSWHEAWESSNKEPWTLWTMLSSTWCESWGVLCRARRRLNDPHWSIPAQYILWFCEVNVNPDPAETTQYVPFFSFLSGLYFHYRSVLEKNRTFLAQTQPPVCTNLNWHFMWYTLDRTGLFNQKQTWATMMGNLQVHLLTSVRLFLGNWVMPQKAVLILETFQVLNV